MFKEKCEKFLTGKHAFSELAPYPKGRERSAWENIDEEARRELIKRGEAFLGFDYPYLKATDFCEFYRTGNRVHYEDRLFIKRKALDALVLAECVEHSGRFMDDIINGIFAICDESAWQHPAHNAYFRSSPILILPDTSNPVIELFSCETAAVLATVYYLLKDELDTFSPLICSRIVDEVEKRVITPYTTKHFWWMGNGDEAMCNWTIWCTQNVLLSAFLLPFSDDIRHIVFKKACESTDFFLKDYGDDGCCDEGAQYYRHAGLCLYQTLDILCRITDGYFNSLWNNEKIKNIALYILNVHVDDKYYINFADCSPVAGRAGTREYLFGKACRLDNLSTFAAQDYKRNPEKFQPDENNLYYRLQEVFTRKDILSENTDAPILHPQIFYPSVGLWIARNDTYTAAVKCGDNDDSHNHNDTGSITLYKNGSPLLADIGVESYTQKTFSAQRYEIWTMQSDYHNLPTINGAMQMNGPEYRATNIHHSFTADGGEISMDIAKAYPAEAHIKNYTRSVLLSASGIKLNDSWSFNNVDNVDDDTIHSVILNFITYERPVVQMAEGYGNDIYTKSDNNIDNICNNKIDTKIRTINIGSLAKLCLYSEPSEFSDYTDYSDFSIQIEELPITDPRLMQCWKHSLYRIRIEVPGNRNRVEVVIS